MASDRARNSYDERRQYRSVVSQQGRVTLEADANEAEQIAAEEQRREALDFVGPAGTPDNGYEVLPPSAASTATYDFAVGPGTMYVGGERSYLYEQIDYSTQPEWLDHSGDPEWADPDKEPAGDQELVYLSLREQEVGAVEDTPLREVALGGPDSAQRSRLVQRIKRLPTTADRCSELRDAEAIWAAQGLRFDPQTMRLESSATLQVSFPTTGATGDPCEPAAQGGYLGADNQLIRVQVSSWDPANGTGTFVWGFDDASFLYRVTVVNANTLRLAARPPDALHNPRSGQAVEVLRTAVQLDTGDFIASDRGQVFTLTAPYVPDTQEVTLPGTGVDPEVLDPDATPMVFLRVWEEELAFKAGDSVSLGDTGMDVTLDAAGEPFHPGDFWCIGARPSTPTQVYPHRLLDAPQPPDGPRLWACPLAIVGWAKETLEIVQDCRVPFEPLTRRRGGGCCEVLVRPEDLTGGHTLQDVIDGHAKRDQVTICLMPGVYELPAPLRLGPENSNLTIEGCHDGVWLQAANGAEKHFLQGLVVLANADNVTLRGLRFRLPQVRFGEAGGKFGGLTSTQERKALGTLLRDLTVSIGIRPLHCKLLTVEECVFMFPLSPDADCFAVGVLAGSECRGLQLRQTQFMRDSHHQRAASRRFQALFGVVLAPAVSASQKQTGERGITRATVVPTLLDDALIRDNLFDGLTGAALLMSDFGTVAIEDNVVRNCLFGFGLLAMRSTAGLTLVNRFTAVPAAGRGNIEAAVRANSDTAATIGLVIARAYPLPREFDADHKLRVEVDEDDTAAQKIADETGRDLVQRSAGGEETVDVADLQRDATGLGLGDKGVERFARLDRDQAAIQVIAVPSSGKQAGLRSSLRVESNDVTVGVGGAKSSFALIVFDDVADDGSSITLAANTLRGNLPGAVASILAVDRCAINGNAILNRGARGESLSVFAGAPDKDRPSERVAVCGNVFGGRANLPARLLPAPLDTWEVFNAFA